MKPASLAPALILLALLTACSKEVPTPQSTTHPDITVSQPQPNATVQSPLTVTGQARGTWYFEASFPVKLYDASNNLLVAVPAQAQSDWMTTDFVPFQAVLTYTVSSPQAGTLVLEKDNPSGEPQNAASISMPVQLVP